MMRLIVCLALLISSHLYAQDLLMNGGFEDENICTEYIKNCAPEGWISTSLRADYYFDDVKNAFEGQHFVGLVIEDEGPGKMHDYIRSRLLCGLRPGAEYRLEFYIRSVHPVLDSIGIYFSPDDILYRKGGMKKTAPQVWLTDVFTPKNSAEWQKVSLVYKANGQENFIAIGDFKVKDHLYGGYPDLGKDYYFFLDKISLKPVNPSEKLCADAGKIKEEAYDQNERHGLLEKMVYRYSKFPPAIAPAGKTILQRIDTLVIPDVLFATNSYALSEKAFTVLDSFIKTTSRFSIDSIVVEGHTDSTGSVGLNQKLSLNRALSVAAYLQPKYSFTLSTRGWASEKPVADNKTPAGRQKNRRVEVLVYVRE